MTSQTRSVSSAGKSLGVFLRHLDEQVLQQFVASHSTSLIRISLATVFIWFGLENNMRPPRPQFLIFPFLLMLTLVFMIACGAAATPTPVPEDAMNQTGETMTQDSSAMIDAPLPAEKELVSGWYQGRV